MAKFVVMHNLVCGHFSRGQVVEGSQLGDQLNRCLDLGAVRPATAEESGHDQLTLAGPERHLAAESAIAEKDEEIARLRERLKESEQSRQVAEEKLAVKPDNKPDNKAAGKLKARVAELENLLVEKDTKLAALEEQLTAPSAE